MADTSSARPHDVITIVGKVAINGNFTNNCDDIMRTC